MSEISNFPKVTTAEASDCDGLGNSIVGYMIFDGEFIPVIYGPERNAVSISGTLQERGVNMTGWSLTVIDQISSDGRYLVGVARYQGTSTLSRIDLQTTKALHDVKLDLVQTGYYGSSRLNTITVQLQLTNGQISTHFLRKASDGYFHLKTYLEGQVRARITASGFLSRVVDLTIDDNVASIALNNGDVDRDDVIGLFDYLRLSAAFDSAVGDPEFDADADIDGDGVVSLFDYLTLSANFDRAGESF